MEKAEKVRTGKKPARLWIVTNYLLDCIGNLSFPRTLGIMREDEYDSKNPKNKEALEDLNSWSKKPEKKFSLIEVERGVYDDVSALWHACCFVGFIVTNDNFDEFANNHKLLTKHVTTYSPDPFQSYAKFRRLKFFYRKPPIPGQNKTYETIQLNHMYSRKDVSIAGPLRTGTPALQFTADLPRDRL